MSVKFEDKRKNPGLLVFLCLCTLLKFARNLISYEERAEAPADSMELIAIRRNTCKDSKELELSLPSCQLYLVCIFIAGKGEFYLGSTSCLIRGLMVLVVFI